MATVFMEKLPTISIRPRLGEDAAPLIQVEGVSKKFCLSLKKSLWYGLKDMGNELLGRQHGGRGQLRPKEFWAVQGVDFELKRGECLGLIGRNGAGKTTLLKMLNGLIKPDAGQITMRGRVGALIALGAGFNPILTGRENIYVNASVLGMSKREIETIFDQIVAFADIGDFLDTPVQNYSSGMAVRLGFAIAAMLDPDVLLVDEVLAVGDYQFALKCYKRIGELLKQGTSVILVSHQMQTVANFCTRAALMERGRMTLYDDVDEAIARYKSQGAAVLPAAVPAPVAQGLTIWVRRADGPADVPLQAGAPCEFRFTLEGAAEGGEAFCEVSFKDEGGNLFMRERSEVRNLEPGRGTFTLSYAAFPLYAPRIMMGVSFWKKKGVLLAWNPEAAQWTGAAAAGRTELVQGQGRWTSEGQPQEAGSRA